MAMKHICAFGPFLLVYQNQKKHHPQPSTPNAVFHLLNIPCHKQDKLLHHIIQKFKHGMQVIDSGSQ